MTNTVDEIYNNPPVLSIGYFPNNSFDNKKFVIGWGGDGTEDEITFSQSYKNKYPNLEYEFRLWLNGTELTGINTRQITIIR